MAFITVTILQDVYYSFHLFITTIGENFVTLFIENLFHYSDKQLFNSEKAYFERFNKFGYYFNEIT